jgi:hypothetical protein
LHAVGANLDRQPIYSTFPWHPLAPAEATAPTYLNVFTVEEYESNGKTQKRWTKIGAAFPHKDGVGFNIELKAFPVDGRLVALPPDPDDERSK